MVIVVLKVVLFVVVVVILVVVVEYPQRGSKNICILHLVKYVFLCLPYGIRNTEKRRIRVVHYSSWIYFVLLFFWGFDCMSLTNICVNLATEFCKQDVCTGSTCTPEMSSRKILNNKKKRNRKWIWKSWEKKKL